MSSCECGHHFVDAQALSQHISTKHHNKCLYCPRIFKTLSAALQHTIDAGHCVCDSCLEHFSSRETLVAHKKFTGHCYCKECDELSIDKTAYMEHMSSSEHGNRFHCSDCNRVFASKRVLKKHLHSSEHMSQFHCCDCDRDFVNEHALNQHLRYKVHTVTRTPEWMCTECDREFGGKKALKKHRESLIHKPISNLKCIAPGCSRRFKSPSSMLHHLESGGCKSGLDRYQIDHLIYENDVDGVVTNRDQPMYSSLIDDASSISSSGTASEDVIYTPTSSTNGGVSIDDLSDALSTLSTVDKKGIHCPKCPQKQRTFNSLQALQQHLHSAAHASLEYQCPVSLLPGVETSPMSRQKFSTLSGLVQHLESGACKGGLAMLKETARYVEDKLKEMGWKGSLLLS